jgi:head-tail adaptor
MIPIFVDPRLVTSLDSHFPSLCTVQRLTETVDDDGQVATTWTDRYAAVSCNVMPLKGREIKGPNQTYVVATTAIALQGHYDDIKESDRAVVDGTTYDILLVEQILGSMTRLSCEVVR